MRWEVIRFAESRLDSWPCLKGFGNRFGIIGTALLTVGIYAAYCGIVEAAQDGPPPPDPVPAELDSAPSPSETAQTPDALQKNQSQASSNSNSAAKPSILPRIPVHRFELKADGMSNPSMVAKTDKTLTIRAPDGSQHKYQRNLRYDTADGEYIGFSSRELQQIIRWPTSNSGPMEIGALKNGVIEFRQSQMQVTKVGVPLPNQNRSSPLAPGLVPVPSPTIPPIPVPGTVAAPLPVPGGMILPKLTPLAFSNGASLGNYLIYEGTDPRNEIRIRLDPNPRGDEATWFINPVAKDSVRIQVRVGNHWYALAPNIDDELPGTPRDNMRRPRPPHLSPVRTDHIPVGLHRLGPERSQIWRVIPGRHYGYSGGYVVENLLLPGFCLAMPHAGPMRTRLCLEPIAFEAWQMWYPAEPIYEVPVPMYETRHHEFVPNAELNPAEIVLFNDHTDEILLVITDRRAPQSSTELRIPAGQSKNVKIDRDSGGQIHETVAFTDGLGNWHEETYTTDVPPQSFYEVSVYEIFLQSIAIDRTGTSPNPVEDVNFQPRGIGLFIIPPGEATSDGTRLNPYALAEQQGNPGAVRQLTDRELNLNAPKKVNDPLKDILNQFQKPQAAF